MIKKFEEYINEDYFSKLASRKDNGDVRKENKITEEIVMEYFNNNYVKPNILIRKENGETIVDVDGNFYLKRNTDKIPFQFGKVTGDFNCAACVLESLEGCPKEVGGSFTCTSCVKLTSIKGCPEKVGDGFYCNACVNLTSLEGVSEEVGGSFDCSGCRSLTSLDGCPKYVNRHFSCANCAKLTSIKGCPQEVGDKFYCENCGKQFTEKEVKSLCNVKGRIFV